MGAPLTRESLYALLGFKVNQLSLYHRAFQHKSATVATPQASYERLELLGDKVIDLIVTRLLFEKFPDKCEGFLTKLRTKLVSGQCLSMFAKQLGLERFVVMNEKALANGWNHNERILEDVFEALIGCIYLDCGLSVAREYLVGVIYTYINFDDLLIDHNFKDLCMRTSQAMFKTLPVYRHAETVCPFTNAKQYEVCCYVSPYVAPLGYGVHRNKKSAEQLSARQALTALGIDVTNQTI